MEPKPQYDIRELMDLMRSKGFTKLKMGSLELECSAAAFPVDEKKLVPDETQGAPTEKEILYWSTGIDPADLEQ